MLLNDTSYIVSNSSARWVTKSNWKFTCGGTTGAAESFIGVAPNGLTYTFAKRADINPRVLEKNNAGITRFESRLLVTHIEDRFGNYVDYSYDSDGDILSITASDGRQITFSYTGNYVTSMAYNGRVWEYNYNSGYQSLVEVVQPDGTAFEYDLYDYYRYSAPTMSSHGCDYDPNSLSKPGIRTTPFSVTVTGPTGVEGIYTFELAMHGRSNVSKLELPADGTGYVINPCSANFALTEKTLSIPGQGTKTWTYDYSQNVGYFAGTTPSGSQLLTDSNLPSNIDNKNYRRTTVTAPNGTQAKYFFNRDFTKVAEGQLEAVQVFDDVGSLMQEVRHAISYNSSVGDDLTIYENDLPARYRAYTTKTVTKLDGTEYTSNFSSFNKYGNYAYKNELMAGGDTKYWHYTYVDDTTNWLIGQPGKVEVSATNGSYTTISETTYYSATHSYKGAPYQSKKFGSVLRTLSGYTTAGLLSSYYDAALVAGTSNPTWNRGVQFSNFKLGVPQTFATYQLYVANTTYNYAYAYIDDNGWTTQVKDFQGNVTNYTYDEMGRVKTVNPALAAMKDSYYDWNFSGSQPTLTVSRCTLNSGSTACTSGTTTYKEVTTFDGLLNPDLVARTDVTNSATRYSQFTYDELGQLEFSGFPSTSSSQSLGVTYTYDALKRPLTQATYGGGTTTYDYLSGNRTQVTDGEGNTTTTTYLAYGSPSKQAATLIASPENTTTTLDYDMFDNVTSITQAGNHKTTTISITEQRAYDSMHRLCKVTRPDIGVTVYEYNTFGDMTYMAQGVTSTSATDCTYSGASGVNYSYDNLGLLWKVDYEDSGTPDITYTRNKNGDVTQINSNSVITNYTYDAARQLTAESLTVNSKTFSMSYGYDALGHQSTMTYPGSTVGTVSYAPNGFGEPTKATRSGQNYVTGVTYYPNGMLNYFAYANGIKHQQTLNSSMLPSQLRYYTSAQSKVYFAYTYDNNFNLDSLTDNMSSAYSLNSLSYDGLNRLIAVDGGSGIGDSTIDYDALGNIEYYSSNSAALTYTYSTSTNRLLDISGTGSGSYNFNASGSYDSRGNILKNGLRTFNYNRANQMTQSGTISYQYDGNNRRVLVNNNGSISYSMYNQAGQLVYRETPSGTGIAYIYLGNKLVAKDGSGNTVGDSIEPTVNITCNPSSCSKTEDESVTVTVTLTASCDNGCTTQWNYSDIFFANSSGTNPKSYYLYCGSTSQTKTGTVSVKITDSVNGTYTVSPTKTLTLTCNGLGGGGEDPL